MQLSPETLQHPDPPSPPASKKPKRTTRLIEPPITPAATTTPSTSSPCCLGAESDCGDCRLSRSSPEEDSTVSPYRYPSSEHNTALTAPSLDSLTNLSFPTFLQAMQQDDYSMTEAPSANPVWELGESVDILNEDDDRRNDDAAANQLSLDLRPRTPDSASPSTKCKVT